MIDTMPDDAIAIIGCWCRVPGALSPEAFWRNIAEGRNCISTLSLAELQCAGVPEGSLADPAYVPRRGLLDEATAFDTGLFDITPAEALQTDPQHRQFLEGAWLAFADAGYCPDERLGKTGVFAAQSENGYKAACLAANGSENGRFRADILSSAGHLAANVAYRFGLDGPAISVQAACSSSLVAVHLACRALQSGDCDMALAGGVSIGWPQHVGHLYQEGGIMSRDGECRPFDRDASGTVRGEGLGVVVLKRLAEAQAARDSIRAVIRCSAVNNDGHERAGYTAPSAQGQVAVIRQALDRAGLVPQDVDYLEAHGTGTLLGDAIELDAIGEALDGAPALRIGSVKGNIGHLDAAAGVIGLIKTVLMVEHERIAPSLHHCEFSDHAGKVSVSVPGSLTDWEREPRIAGVSSFGLGGTNAHVIVQSAPLESPPGAAEPRLIPLSAASADALEHLRDELAGLLRQEPDRPLHDIARTLQVGRRAMRHRLALVADTSHELIRRLGEARCETGAGEATLTLQFDAALDRDALELVRAFHHVDISFADHFDKLSRKIDQLCGIDLRTVLQSADADRFAEPLAGCAGHALALRLLGAGVRPASVRGTSVGAAVAAAMAGRIDLDTLANVIATGSREGDAAGAEALADALADSPAGASDIQFVQGASMTDGCEANNAIIAPFRMRAASRSLPASTAPDARRMFLGLLGQCWARGADVDWSKLDEKDAVGRVHLPHPALKRERYFHPAVIPDRVADEPVAVSVPEDASSAEPLVLRCVKEVLGTEDVRITDNFFEIGGCSITALELRERLGAVAGRDIDLHAIFDSQTLAELAPQLRSCDGAGSAEGGMGNTVNAAPARSAAVRQQAVGGLGVPGLPSLSVFFFAGVETVRSEREIYDLVQAAAQFADDNGFEAVWTPERHFHDFGAAFPAPAILAAAIAAKTSRIHLRAGSVVLPLNDPLRLAEEWAVVDRLSGGRIGISFAPGFHPTDFIGRKEQFETRRETFWPKIDLLRSLWRGEPHRGIDGAGRETDIRIRPEPLQPDLPVWVTASESGDTFQRAGEIGANVLTGLMAQDLAHLRQNILLYRAARKQAGHDRGHVTLMLHSFTHPDPAVVDRVGRAGLRRYLDLHLDFAAKREDNRKLEGLAARDRSILLDHAEAKYMAGRSLIGTPEACAKFVTMLTEVGVDEIACLVDFGPEKAEVLGSLGELARLMRTLRPISERQDADRRMLP
ncbi:MupA/Atu3671 family FMN-dependent luciferase-like monooxygenase [Roseibium album]|uniref:MupA/Atu3671 family FMN-dependent luciferase-like monooxygenase n=1 Tax=Roseibium album TaxID=311410 RepID=UPI00248FFDC3|nr:MupA/Atu3671 family FMN-dependent luciferase-like monooxygenase [Roseibium album]